jgi:Uma2 family endonuclease
MAMPQISWAQSAETELADLEALWQRLDIPGHRVELVGGQIVVSPTASARHSTIVYELTDALINLTRKHGWIIHSNLAVHIAATRERLIPDLMVAPRDAPRFADSELRSHGVLLVAEVVSPSSQRQDRVVKTRAYAQGHIPLYMLIDTVAEPVAVTLFSDPGQDGYGRCEQVQAGQALLLPEPFGISVSADKLLA